MKLYRIGDTELINAQSLESAIEQVVSDGGERDLLIVEGCREATQDDINIHNELFPNEQRW